LDGKEFPGDPTFLALGDSRCVRVEVFIQLKVAYPTCLEMLPAQVGNLPKIANCVGHENQLGTKHEAPPPVELKQFPDGENS